MMNYLNARMKLKISFFCFCILFLSCQENQQNHSQNTSKMLKEGNYRAILNIDEENSEIFLPFNFSFSAEKITIFNAEEKILVEDISFQKDSILIEMPVFDSKIKAKISGDSLIGKWFKYEKAVRDYQIPFMAYLDKNRFKTSKNPTENISGKWEAHFSPNTEDEYPAIGIFNQNESKITGTFLTETGDYRYLEGVLDGNTMKLSCFDGAHAFLFHAEIQEDKTLKGTFWSGNSWQEPWIAKQNPDASLADMESLTFLKEGFEKLEFSFPNMDSNLVSLSDERFKNRVTIVQIMGTWCPNCMDETRYLADVYRQYNSVGLEIIGLAYEVAKDFEVVKNNISKLKKDLNANYDFLHAGTANKKEAAQTLPMLNKIISFPTAIFIDKKGEIRKIQTGFSGPAAGKIYTDYVSNTNQFIEELLAE